MFKYGIAVVSLGLLLAGSTYAAGQKALVVTPKQKQFTLTLNSNPTTGYRWFLVGYDHKLLKPIAYHYILPKKKLIGAGGKAQFVFAVEPTFHAVPQMTTIDLTYARPWESPANAPIDKITVVSQV